MSRHLVVLEVLAAFALASCGSSSHRRTSTSQSPTATTVQTATPAPTGAGAGPGAGPPMTTTPTAPAPGTPGSTGSAPAGGQEKIRLPASFTIKSGAVLSPRSVSSPAFLALELTVASADGRAHHVLVRTPRPHSLSVRAGAKASTLIPGLAPGRYSVLVDGTVRGTLLIGGEPGP